MNGVGNQRKLMQVLKRRFAYKDKGNRTARNSLSSSPFLCPWHEWEFQGGRACSLSCLPWFPSPSRILVQPFSPKATCRLLNTQTYCRVHKAVRNLPKEWDAAEQHWVYQQPLINVSMRHKLTFPISSFRWSGNNCTGWNHCWNHCCSWNPCRNHNCSCEEDVRQVLVSKLLTRFFLQAFPLSRVTGITWEISKVSTLTKQPIFQLYSALDRLIKSCQCGMGSEEELPK